MYPTICKIGPVAIHSYGVMVAIAAIVCSLLMAKEAKRISLKPDDIFDLVFWAVLGGILGGRIFYIFLNWSYYMTQPLEIVMVQKGGLAWQGSFIFGTAVVLGMIRYKKWRVLVMVDFIAPYLALGHAIGRVGCFLNGCCYGRHADWGVYFPVHADHLHPTQLYEMALLIGLFFVLKKSQGMHEKIPGAVFALYLIFAPAIRFGVEFFRADHQPLFLNLSIFQYVSLCLFFVGIITYLYLRRKHA